eukprot:RCo012459
MEQMAYYGGGGGMGSAREPVLKEFSLSEIAQRILDGKAKRIIVMSGAGISVAAGIPDFRSPGTGLYAQLEKYDLPFPEAVFELDFFREHPEPFFIVAKEMWPGNYEPTDVHLFIKLLSQKGLLLRNYTQNIDCLERAADVNANLLVECHGTFATAHTIDPPFKSVPVSFIKEKLDAGETVVRDPETGSLVKPDIVFFGEDLPARFFTMSKYDFPSCDLLLVMGTSLMVFPFAGLVSAVPDTCPRVLFNQDLAGDDFLIGQPGNYRDVGALGDVQAEVRKLVQFLGWEEELRALKQVYQPGKGPANPTVGLERLASLKLRDKSAEACLKHCYATPLAPKSPVSPLSPLSPMGGFSSLVGAAGHYLQPPRSALPSSCSHDWESRSMQSPGMTLSQGASPVGSPKPSSGKVAKPLLSGHNLADADSPLESLPPAAPGEEIYIVPKFDDAYDDVFGGGI